MSIDKTELLFRIYKDQELTDERKKSIRKNFPDINARELFVKITNYQVDKYGSTIYVNMPEISDYRDKRRAYKIQKIQRYRKGKDRKDENFKRMGKKQRIN